MTKSRGAVAAMALHPRRLVWLGAGRSASSGRSIIATSTANAQTGDRVVRGMGMALLTFTIFSCADAAVKWLSARYSIFQIISISTLFALVPVTGLILRGGSLSALRPRHPWLVAARAILLAVDIVMVYFAFTRLSLAEAYALLFMVPMLVTALSVPLLGEQVGWRRWTAVVVGFIGILIVLRPGLSPLNLGHLAALGSTMFFALSLIIARRIGNSESAGSLLLSMMVAVLVISLPAMADVYVPPSAVDLVVLAGLGLLMGTGHLGLIQASRLAPSNLVAPFHYSQMIWAVIFGLLLFGDRPDQWVIVGSAVIIGSGLYILWRETVRARQAAAA